MATVTIRTAVLADLQAIVDIYNDSVVNSVATFDTELKTVETRRCRRPLILPPTTEFDKAAAIFRRSWFVEHTERHPVWVVAEPGPLSELVVGWADLHKWSDRGAYKDTAELSIYLRSTHRGKGFGKRLMQHLLNHAKCHGFHTVIGRISDGNPASNKLHESVGFKYVGLLKEVGFKFDRFIDVHIYQIMMFNYEATVTL